MKIALIYTLISVVFIITLRKPVLGFWISLALFFDPGGFFNGYFSSNLIGPVNISDAFFLLMSLSFMFNLKLQKPVYNKAFLNFIRYFIFIEVYFIFVYGYLIPEYYNRSTFSLFLIKERNFFYGFFILWFVYVFAQRGLLHHYKITVYSGIVILSLFILGQLTGYDIVPVTRNLRYQGDSMMRLSMLSYGLFQFVLPMAVIIVLIRRSVRINIPLIKYLYSAGLLMAIVLLLTLTRRTYINIIAIVVFSLYIVSRFIRIKNVVFSIAASTIFLILILILVFPSYLRYSVNIYEDTFLLLTEGQDSRGRSDYRLSGTGDMEYVKEYIKDKPLFGQGFTWMAWDVKIERAIKGDKFAKAWDAAQEVPVYYMIFSKGFVGVLLYSPIYIMLIATCIKLYRYTKSEIYFLITEAPLVLLFIILILINYLQDFSVKIYSIYEKIGEPSFMLEAGLLFYLYTFVKEKSTPNHYNIQPYRI